MGQHGERAGAWWSPSHPSPRPDPSLLGRSAPLQWGGLAMRSLAKREKGGKDMKMRGEVRKSRTSPSAQKGLGFVSVCLVFFRIT